MWVTDKSFEKKFKFPFRQILWHTTNLIFVVTEIIETAIWNLTFGDIKE